MTAYINHRAVGPSAAVSCHRQSSSHPRGVAPRCRLPFLVEFRSTPVQMLWDRFGTVDRSVMVPLHGAAAGRETAAAPIAQRCTVGWIGPPPLKVLTHSFWSRIISLEGFTSRNVSPSLPVYKHTVHTGLSWR